MNQCNVQFYCPPMKINRYPDGGFMCMRTDAEPMVCTVNLLLPGEPVSMLSKEITISPVTIPPTLSRFEPPFSWLVNACVGEGSDGPKGSECQFCDFRGTLMEGAEHRKETGHLIRLSQGSGNRIRVELPKERVAFKWWNSKLEMYEFDAGRSLYKPYLLPILVAEPIDAVCTLWLADGRIFRTDPNVPDSFVRFGECKVIDPLFNPTAEAITTTKGNLVEVTNG